MGFLNRIGNFLNTSGYKLYNGIKSGVSTGYNLVSGVAHKIGTISDGIDGALTQIRAVPVIGQAAAALQNHPYYQEGRALIKTGVGVVDQVGQFGRDVLKPIDQAITSGAPQIQALK